MFARRAVVTFEEGKIKATKRWVENGKRRQVTKTFCQTINPWNKRPDGEMKTFDDIMIEIKAQRQAWLDDKEAR